MSVYMHVNVCIMIVKSDYTQGGGRGIKTLIGCQHYPPLLGEGLLH